MRCTEPLQISWRSCWEALGPRPFVHQGGLAFNTKRYPACLDYITKVANVCIELEWEQVASSCRLGSLQQHRYSLWSLGWRNFTPYSCLGGQIHRVSVPVLLMNQILSVVLPIRITLIQKRFFFSPGGNLEVNAVSQVLREICWCSVLYELPEAAGISLFYDLNYVSKAHQISVSSICFPWHVNLNVL